MFRLFLVAVALAIAAGQAKAEFHARFWANPPADLQRWPDLLKQSNLHTHTANHLNRSVTLQRRVLLSFNACGAPNAFYHPGQQEITFCYELLSDISARIMAMGRSGGASRDQTAAALGGAMWFVLFHEVGHAVFHQLDLPLLGREEDAADQLAVWLAIRRPPPGYDNAVLGALAFFAQGQPISWDMLGDEHALNEQRLQNVACWAFGADPVTYHGLPAMVRLPDRRKARCAAEWEAIDRTVPRLLGRALRPAKLTPW